jgi:opacity protein-like surface antigen
MNRTRSAPLVWLVALSLTPAVVSAQTVRGGGQGGSNGPAPPEVRRPYRGLFGGPDNPTRTSLVLTAALYVAYDDDIYAADTGSSTALSGPRTRGFYQGAQAGLAFNRPSDRVSFNANADLAVNHYPSQDDYSPTFRGAGGMGVQLTDRSRLNVNAASMYAPEYRLGLFVSPIDLGPIGLGGLDDPFDTVGADYDLYRLKTYRSVLSVAYHQSIGRRSTLSAAYAAGLAHYVGSNLDYFNQGGGVGLEHPLTRNMSAHLGYFYSTANYTRQSDSRPLVIHNIDAGLSYGRALSISRRTHLSFSTGTALVATDSTPLDSVGRDVNFRVIGNAALNHEIGRSWTAAVGYARSVDYHEGFVDPFLSDAVSASITGLLSRSLRFDGVVNYSFGIVGFNSDNGFYAATANAGLEYGLTRRLAVYANYLYYQYRFDQPAALDPRLAQALNRQGARVGLRASFPLVR